MRTYTRTFVPGGTFFFTVNLADRSTTLLTDHIEALRDSVRRVREAHPFHIVAMVVLPEHLHAIWTLPENDADYPTRWALIKAGFSRRLAKVERINPSRRRKGERGIWQRRIGSIRYATRTIWRGISITSITIRSNTVMCTPPATGRIRLSTVLCGKATCLPIGE